MRPFLVALVSLVFLAGSFSGCLSGDEPQAKEDPKARLRRGASVINLNASLLDTAQFAADERFGPDRPLTQQDIPGLLPKALTNYNITLAYVLNMSLYPNIKAYQIGETLTGRAIFGLLMTDDGEFHPERPSIMFTCSQHGNEPSGSEACLIFIEYFTHGTDKLAQDVRAKLNIVINPLANPDGKESNRRGNYDQVDINRDHMNLATLEGRAIHAAYNLFNPIIGLDLHEFGGAGAPPPVDPPAVTTRQTFQIAGPEGVADDDRGLFVSTNELLRHVFTRSSEKFKYGSTGYYTGSTSAGAFPSVHRHHM
ncbi:MAG TPA: M14 family zinc carboxypeptidase, partial [Candidatus Thermoplasmatota archaeon]|nr:M14 family zinc carboxypeptidase [Candidatus Thermoplasmatota archaeon]